MNGKYTSTQWKQIGKILSLPKTRELRDKLQNLYGEASYREQNAATHQRVAIMQADRGLPRHSDHHQQSVDEITDRAEEIWQEYREKDKEYTKYVNSLCAEQGLSPYIESGTV